MIKKIDKILPSLKKQTYLKYFVVNKLSVVCASIAFRNKKGNLHSPSNELP